MAGAPIIVADAVSKKFGAHQVLTRVSLPVMERDVVCIVGPSGSGKTTLLRCVALLETPSEGRIVMILPRHVADGVEINESVGPG